MAKDSPSALDAAAVKKSGDTSTPKTLEEQLADARAQLATRDSELADANAKLAAASGKPAAPKEPVELKEAPVYVVQETARISWGGQDIVLHRGQEVSDSSYGPGTYERMTESGVKLELKPAAKTK